MRILHISMSLDRGGVETLLLNVTRNINRDKYKFDFLVYGKKEYAYENEVKSLGCKVIRMEKPTEIGMFNYIKKMKKIIKEGNYDVVHAHSLFNCGPVMFAAWLAGVKKRISHSHSTNYLEKTISFKKKIYYRLSKLLINIFSTECIACGEEAGKFLYYKFKKFKIINNGIDVEKFKFNSKIRNQLRKKYNILDNDLVIGNVGRLVYIKNQTFLLDIVNEIKKKKKNVKLFIIGDGELKPMLEDKIKALNLQDNVFLMDSVGNINDYYNMFDCFVFPSLFEGVPCVLIEAQCNGLPILASSNISVESDITKSIDFFDINYLAIDWANKIIDINNIRNDNIRIIKKSKYSIESTIESLLNLYNK